MLVHISRYNSQFYKISERREREQHNSIFLKASIVSLAQRNKHFVAAYVILNFSDFV
jgi:hypothetical protein